MGQRRKFSAEYKREAVAMLDAPGVSVSQIAAELGLGPMSWDGGDASCTGNLGKATGAPAMRS